MQQIIVLNLVLHKGCDAAVSLFNSYSEYILRWGKKYVRFHTMDSRDDLNDGEKRSEDFLACIAVNKNAA